MAIKFNPLAGIGLDIAGTSAPPVSATFRVENIVLLSGNETSKSVTLSLAPTDNAYTVLLVKDAPNQYYGDDFTVSGSTLSWAGRGLDGILQAGDKITVIYN